MNLKIKLLNKINYSFEMTTLPTTSTMIKHIRSLAKLCVNCMTTEDEYGVEKEVTCNIEMFHILTMLESIVELVPDPDKIIVKMQQDIMKLIMKSNIDYDKSKTNKPKMFDQAKNELNFLLDYDPIDKITDEAIIYFACVLEIFNQKNEYIPVIPVVPAPVPVKTIPVVPTNTDAQVKTDVVVVPKKRGRPKKVTT